MFGLKRCRGDDISSGRYFRVKIFKSLDDPAVADLLLEGAVGVLPTDTVYGLVCRAADETAVKRLYALKHRQNKPGTVIAASGEQLAELGVPNRALKVAEGYWPGAVSVEIAHSLAYLHQNTGRQAFRVPDQANLVSLMIKTGPLQTTSANEPGQPTAKTAADVASVFGDSIDFLVDGGDLGEKPPSTIIRIVDDYVEVMREGAVKIDEYGRIIT